METVNHRTGLLSMRLLHTFGFTHLKVMSNTTQCAERKPWVYHGSRTVNCAFLRDTDMLMAGSIGSSSCRMALQQWGIGTT